MSKELPYFRFMVTEWLNDDISLENYEVKGVFADICAYYWFKDCSITQAMLQKKFSNAETLIKNLFSNGIIKTKQDSDFIEIKFLNEQFDQLSESRKRRQNAGAKGGKQRSSNAKAKLKQSKVYKEKNKNKNNIEERETIFLSEVWQYKEQYSEEMLKAFINYWTEKNRSRTKMLWETKETFEISKRLSTWANRNKSPFTKTEEPTKLKITTGEFSR